MAEARPRPGGGPLRRLVLGLPWELRSTTLHHVVAVILTLVVATLLFAYVEGRPLGESVYFVILIMTLIGANINPRTAAGVVLTSVLAIVSVGIIISFIGQVLGPLALDKYYVGIKARRISRMEDHVVICGYSDTARALVEGLAHGGVLFVVRPGEAADHLTARGLAVVVGDYTSQEALRRAGVERCRAVVALSPVDSENAFVCLSSKKLAPSVPVIATVSSEENQEKLEEVGADHIISPALLSADSILRILGGPAGPPRAAGR